MFILYGDYRVNLVSTTTDGDLVVPKVQQPSIQRAKSHLVLRSNAGLCNRLGTRLEDNSNKQWLSQMRFLVVVVSATDHEMR